MIKSGTFNLGTPKASADARLTGMDRRFDYRVQALAKELLAFEAIDEVVFEDVQFSSTQMQSQLWSAFRTTAWLSFPKATWFCVPVGTLKLFATGSGKAEKVDMAIALKKEGYNLPEADDNEVDAVWLGLYHKAASLGQVSYKSVHEKKLAAKAERKAKKKAKVDLQGTLC